MSQNAWKYIVVLGFGALVGLGDVFAHPMFPGWWEVVRQSGAGMVTAAVGLQVSLDKKA